MQVTDSHAKSDVFWDSLITIACTLVCIRLPSIGDAAAVFTSPTPNLTTAYNLTVPQLPGFTVNTRYVPQRPINGIEMYTLVVEGMASVGPSPWEGPIDVAVSFIPPKLHCQVVAAPLPARGPSNFRVKHMVLGMYEIGSRMVSQQPHAFFDTYALLSVQGEFVGSIRLQPVARAVTHSDVAPGPFAAEDLSEMRPALPGERFEYQDHSFNKLIGVFNGGQIALEDMFTTFLDALAEAAIPAEVETGAFINAVSAGEPRAVMNVHDVGFSSSTKKLTYGHILHALLGLWNMFITEKKYGGMDFSILLRDKEIGKGWIDEWP